MRSLPRTHKEAQERAWVLEALEEEMGPIHRPTRQDYLRRLETVLEQGMTGTSPTEKVLHDCPDCSCHYALAINPPTLTQAEGEVETICLDCEVILSHG